MTILSRWFPRPILQSADSKGPWGGGTGGGGGTGNGGGSGGGGGEDDKDSGPRSPWTQPPAGKPRGAAGAGPSALDEFLKRARGGGSGPGGFGGGGRPRIPGAPSASTLWLVAVAVIVVAWILLTSFHSIGPQQRGVVTFLGRYSETLEPGIRVTLPAPFVDVAKVDVAAINTDSFPDEAANESDTDKLMLTSDQNIVDLEYSVRWQIANPQDFAFQIADPHGTLRATAMSAMRAAIATATLDDAIGGGRNAIEAKVQIAMQDILDGYNSGIRIQGVAIKGAQAPAQVSDAFKEVSAAQQQAQSDISKARGYAQQVLAKAQGEAAAFDVIYTQYKLAPEVTRRRMYYDTMEQVLSKSDKTIIETPGVVPYLPLPGITKRLPDAAAPAPQAQPSVGGVQ